MEVGKRQTYEKRCKEKRKKFTVKAERTEMVRHGNRKRYQKRCRLWLVRPPHIKQLFNRKIASLFSSSEYHMCLLFSSGPPVVLSSGATDRKPHLRPDHLFPRELLLPFWVRIHRAFLRPLELPHPFLPRGPP